MKRMQVRMDSEFKVLASTANAQVAVMVVPPGLENGAQTTHRHSDQWIYVVSGHGSAVVNGTEVPLQPGTMLLIEANEDHQITASGSQPLETLNFYAPPAY